MKPKRNSPRPKSIHIPEDLLHEVLLPRLSFKSLSRMKGVSKACHAIITSSARFKTLQSLRPTPASTGFVYTDKSGLSFIHNQASIGVPDPSLKFLVQSPQDVDLLSSTNGLLLFDLYGWAPEVNSLCVSNLATMKTEIVPNTPTGIVKRMGLAFNPRLTPSRYAIVDAIWTFTFMGVMKYTFNVFRSDTGRWNLSEQEVHISQSSHVPATPVYAQGLLYWCCVDFVLWYDTEKDCAGTIPLPYSKEEECASKEVSAINDEVFCTCITIEAELEVWKLTSQNEWQRLHKITMEKLIEMSPQTHNYFDLPDDEVARESPYLKHCVSPLAFDGQSIYVAIKSKIWHRGKDLMTVIKKYPPHKRFCMLSRLCDHLRVGYSILDFDINGQSEPEMDLWCCNVISGEMKNIGNGIPAHTNWRLHHYHNSFVAVPPIQSPNI